MHLRALQKTTLLDFPGILSAIVFAQGCNFSCPYCHNAELVPPGGEALPLAEVLSFLSLRARVLQGVVITGGEPTLQSGLPAFCGQLKAMGYAVKLDTNGSRPNVLSGLIREGLVDYVAMDVKADPGSYPRQICAALPPAAIIESMALLNNSETAHEFRVPCVLPFITPESFQAILENAGGAPLFLQTVRPDPVLDPAFFAGTGRPLDEEEISVLQRQSAAYGQPCTAR